METNRCKMNSLCMPTDGADVDDRGRGMTFVALGVFVLSFDSLLVRLSGTDPWNVVFWRGLLIALSLGAVTVARHGWRGLRAPGGGWVALTAALLFGIDTALFVMAVSFTQVATVVVILASSPLFAAVFSRVFLSERLSGRTWVAVCAVLVGVAVVFGGAPARGSLLGNLCALGASILLAAALTVLRLRPRIPRTGMIAASGLVAAVLVVPVATPLSLDAPSYGVLAVMGLVQMPVAMTLLAIGPRYLPAPEVSLWMLVETFLGPLWVWLVMGERPPEATWAGGALIVATLAAHSYLGLRAGRRSGKRAANPAATAERSS